MACLPQLLALLVWLFRSQEGQEPQQAARAAEVSAACGACGSVLEWFLCRDQPREAESWC